ncbi:hypothetical protein FDI69_gp170 [Rhodococcus phage Trina]|uniref:Uncharacterized protein n=1 Tax=Rhodococcus phage Trina TaxID=2027905 RepID=A0A2D1A4E6_9CAUD|nr:hypothetical protein FDI69_gp170 [Rhodococcus phage Trina]ASZ75016.1 hypothetical protein SEA_TRINA_237 [Rhodococcus phage Trina]
MIRLCQVTYTNKQGVQRITSVKSRVVAERLASWLSKRGATQISIKEL